MTTSNMGRKYSEPKRQCTAPPTGQRGETEEFVSSSFMNYDCLEMSSIMFRSEFHTTENAILITKFVLISTAFLI